MYKQKQEQNYLQKVISQGKKEGTWAEPISQKDQDLNKISNL